jgi:hypothetical protein
LKQQLGANVKPTKISTKNLKKITTKTKPAENVTPGFKTRSSALKNILEETKS